MIDLEPFDSTKKTGQEVFSSNNQPLPVNLLDFWRWSTSDLLSNATRGVLAEFIVATALGVDLSPIVREEWAAYDLEFCERKIEVKSAAYVQSWHQNRYSNIRFNISSTREWNKETNIQAKDEKRQADLYIFCLFTSKQKKDANPLNLDEWLFYVLPSREIDEFFGSQKTVSLTKLVSKGTQPCGYRDLRTQVEKWFEIIR